MYKYRFDYQKRQDITLIETLKMLGFVFQKYGFRFFRSIVKSTWKSTMDNTCPLPKIYSFESIFWNFCISRL